MFVEEIIGAFTGQNKRNRRRQVITGTVIGAGLGLLAGSVAALLFAPSSGKETRQKIAKKSKEGLDLAKEYGSRASEYIKSKGEGVVGLAAREARKAARAARRRLRNMEEELCDCTCHVVEPEDCDCECHEGEVCEEELCDCSCHAVEPEDCKCECHEEQK